MTLGILYHMPFWQAADGALWEAEGSFARYVDSLAPYFDEILLSVPVFDVPPAQRDARRRRQRPARAIAVLSGAAAVLPDAAGDARRVCAPGSRSATCIHLRVPTPAGYFAYRIAQRLQKPAFLLVVGDYRALHAAFALSRREESCCLAPMWRLKSGRSAGWCGAR